MRPVNISAGQAKDYYYEKDPIYNKDGKNNGTWTGKGAEMLGLTGEIRKEDFEKIVEGRDPRTGANLVENAGPDRERAGVDIPFSDPKSVSICAHVLKDERLHENKAVQQTIEYLEKHYAYCRQTENGVTRDVHTSNFVVALYNHSIARVDKNQEIKIPDPQNHIHAVISNMTYNKETGKWQATHNDQIFKDQKFITQVYNSFRAKEVRDLGYAIDVKPNGSFEIRGMPQEVIDLFSKRSTGMDNVTEVLKEKFPNMTEAEIRNKISVFENRLDKDPNLTDTQLDKSHKEQVETFGYTKETLKENIDKESVKFHEVQKDIVKMDEYDCIRTAAKSLVESESSFTKTQLLSAATKFGIGNHSTASLDKAFTELQKDREFVDLYDNKTYAHESVYSTPEMCKIEKENVQYAKDGQGTMSAIMGKEEVEKVINEKYSHLTEDQKAAVSHILTNEDKVTIIIGDAGTGKTTMAGAVREMAEARGVEVRGYSKTNEAVIELEKGSGIKSKTIDSHLLNPEKAINYATPPNYGDTYKVPGRNSWDQAINKAITGEHGERSLDNKINTAIYGERGERDIDNKINQKIEQGLNAIAEHLSAGKIHIIDEANTMAAKEFNQFVKTLGPNDRVVAIGDTKQFSSISAGKPIHDMIEGGNKYVNMKETTRFTDKDTKEIVEAAARKEIDTAFAKLEATNKIHQIENREERLNAIAKDYLSTDKYTIVVTNTNQDRHDLNSKIREGLQEKGIVSKNDHTFTIREPRNINPVEKKFAQSYRDGDSIFINKTGFQGAKMGMEGKIISTDQDRNILKCETRRGKTFEVDLRKDSDKISVYEEKDIKLSEGDKIIWNKKDKDIEVVNGTRGEITKIDEHGNIAMRDKEDKITHFNVHDKNNFSHSYCITNYKSEGKTGDRVLFHADTQKHGDAQSGYVGMSRGREYVQVYTNNKEELKEQMKTEHEKESTLKYEKGQEKSDKSDDKSSEKDQNKEQEKDHEKTEDKAESERQEHEKGDEGKAEEHEHEDKGSEHETEHQEYEKSEHETEQEQGVEREHEDNSREVEFEM